VGKRNPNLLKMSYLSPVVNKASKYSYLLIIQDVSDEEGVALINKLSKEVKEKNPPIHIRRVQYGEKKTNQFFFIADPSFYKKIKLSEIDIRDKFFIERYQFHPSDFPANGYSMKLFIPIPDDLTKEEVKKAITEKIDDLIDIGLVEKENGYILRFPETKEGISPRYCYLEFLDDIEVAVIFRKFFSFFPWCKESKFNMTCKFNRMFVAAKVRKGKKRAEYEDRG